MASHGSGPAMPARDFEPKDTLAQTFRFGATTGAFGAIFAGIQNTMTRRNPTFWGFFTRFGGTTVTFAATGATYAFVKNFSANLRETDDSWNAAYGGFLAGSIQGLRRLSFPAFFGYGSALASLLFIFDYTGSRWSVHSRDPDVDEVARKEMIRKNRRRPIAETIAELGEGRGIEAPGFEERRRQRLKETYGIDLDAAGVPSSRH
ncbi:uncharacterized protein PV09_07646 [Verruconis gallopava]|uniref:Uncharacterized protein n=1 Tax=Verruconis gallopava TaxID=253628 RepID=A0A0D2AP48_9PEZI|nr:uncharacterized protein PV09_07646 [Verruconis gallopava]KIW00894.1 hypothetical protein PV09_07646 [Verruconis gallopava]